MYVDVFLPAPLSRGLDLYAVKPLNSGIVHALVTEEQLAKLKADRVAIIPFDKLGSKHKRDKGGPLHVYNPLGLIYDRDADGKRVLYSLEDNTEHGILAEEA